jgi:putative ABC transport system substrate-binding protein
LVLVVHLAMGVPAEAQQSKEIPRIGYLGNPSANERTEALKQGLREFGYIESKNIVIEWRHHGEKLDRLPALAGELVRLKVSIMSKKGVIEQERGQVLNLGIPIV